MARDLLHYFRRQFRYDEWANGEVLGALRNSHASAARGRELLAHILSAELLWLERLQGRSQTQPVWPELSFEQCDEWNGKVARLWRDYLEILGLEDLSKTMTYKNSRGEPWTSTVEDVAAHVLMHSAYHRGQIASWMRVNGETPAYTDFIHAVRQGFVR